MYKTCFFLKRRAGLTVAEFRNYYETHHRVIGEKYLLQHAVYYSRRYLSPLAEIPAEGAPFGHDVMTEIWYPDRTAFEATMAILSQPDAMAEIIADEEQLFDRAAHRAFEIDECVSISERENA